MPICLGVFHSLLWSTESKACVVNEPEVVVFLEFPCFLHDATNVGNLISGSSAFSKPSSYTWKFSVHLLLKPSLKDFEQNLQFSSVQSLSRVRLFENPWSTACQASLSITKFSSSPQSSSLLALVNGIIMLSIIQTWNLGFMLSSSPSLNNKSQILLTLFCLCSLSHVFTFTPITHTYDLIIPSVLSLFFLLSSPTSLPPTLQHLTSPARDHTCISCRRSGVLTTGSRGKSP